MTIMQVKSVQEAKSGRSLRVLLGNSWYGAYKDSGIKEGMLIDPVLETLDKGGPWIVKYVESKNPAPQGSPPSTPQIPPAVSPAVAGPRVPDDNIQPWWAPFMSNMCAHAIQAGLCKSPEALGQWALKAAQVAVATKEAVR